MPLSADYYDGQSSKRQAVELHLEGDRLRVIGADVERTAPVRALRLSEPMGAAPRLITFPDGAVCEVRDTQALQRLLAATGARDALVVRWQFNLRWIALSACLCVLLAYAGYRFGLPWASDKLAAGVPDSVLTAISEQLVDTLDQRFLAPSKLPESRQKALTERFAALKPPPDAADSPAYRVIFRATRGIPANAFALPSGTIILTDDLVTLAEKDNELMGVLAHELGHIQARHGMRQVIQGSLVGLLAAWFIGDISSIAAAAPAALLQARYSRDFEHEADRYAQRLLAANGISPRCLADLLERLEKPRERSAKPSSGDIHAYLASHPPTAQRLDALPGGACQ